MRFRNPHTAMLRQTHNEPWFVLAVAGSSLFAEVEGARHQESSP
jgi:hypothetical protein